MIETHNLTKRYKDGTLAVDRISLRIGKKITAILGRNGAGKTTLLRMLSTQLLPTSGTAKINGHDVVKEPERIREKIISIPQEAVPVGSLTPAEHIEIYLAAKEIYGREAEELAESSLSAIDMLDAKDKLADDLSGGMKRKIFVSMAIASNAEVVFLDEPTLGLDPISRLEVWSAIRELKGDVVITTHYLEEAKELAEEIIMVDSGRIVAKGTAAELLRPLRGLVRVEGLQGKDAHYRIGNTSISYVKEGDAKRYIRKGFKVRPVDLEDMFIMKGIKIKGAKNES